MSRKKVLLTGPSGRIGPHIVGPFRDRYDLVTFDLPGHGADCEGDLGDVESLKRAMKGVEAVVHLAATSDEAPFLEQLVPNNVEGLYNLMEAAHSEGVRRVVFASSVQTIWRHIDETSGPIETEIQAPHTLYGVSKIFGEVLGRWYYDFRKIEFIAVRLGWFEETHKLQAKSWINNVWISPRDAAQLFQKAVDTPDVGYAIVNCTSKTPREILSLQSARELLGYEPEDVAP